MLTTSSLKKARNSVDVSSKELARRGVRLIGVNIRDDRGAATSYLEEFKVGWLQEPDFGPESADEQGRLDKKNPITCPECGHVNPLAYAWNSAKDTAEQKLAREIW